MALHHAESHASRLKWLAACIQFQVMGWQVAAVNRDRSAYIASALTEVVLTFLQYSLKILK